MSIYNADPQRFRQRRDQPLGIPGRNLVLEPVRVLHAKDAGSPRASRFDVNRWQFFVAYIGGLRAGGAVLIMDSPDVEMLDGRKDLALLWDIRVAPAFRKMGVGSALLAALEEWSNAYCAKEIKVETQNINVPACRFYESRAFELRQANAGVYEGLPNEVQLLWNKSLY